MQAAPGFFLDTMQSQAIGAPPRSMCTGFRGMEDTTKVSIFFYTGATCLYRVGPRPSGRITQPLGVRSSVAPTGLSEIPEASEASTAIPEVQLPGRRKRVSIISSILNYPPPTASTSQDQKPIAFQPAFPPFEWDFSAFGDQQPAENSPTIPVPVALAGKGPDDPNSQAGIGGYRTRHPRRPPSGPSGPGGPGSPGGPSGPNGPNGSGGPGGPNGPSGSGGPGGSGGPSGPSGPSGPGGPGGPGGTGGPQTGIPVRRP